MSEDPERERWRGQIDEFVRESREDRTEIREEVRTLADRAEERHRELVDEIRRSTHVARDAMHAVRTEAAAAASVASKRAEGAHRHADLAHQRIAVWEARAQGATWISKYLPALITGAIAWAAGFFANGIRPPGS